MKPALFFMKDDFVVSFVKAADIVTALINIGKYIFI